MAGQNVPTSDSDTEPATEEGLRPRRASAGNSERARDAGDEEEKVYDEGGGGGAGSWSATEDAQLCAMVAKDGTGNWSEKAAALQGGRHRSAGALRFRWYHLRDNSAGAPDTATESTAGSRCAVAAALSV
jgi:hypothetical protein